MNLTHAQQTRLDQALALVHVKPLRTTKISTELVQAIRQQFVKLNKPIPKDLKQWVLQMMEAYERVQHTTNATLAKRIRFIDNLKKHIESKATLAHVIQQQKNMQWFNIVVFQQPSMKQANQFHITDVFPSWNHYRTWLISAGAPALVQWDEDQKRPDLQQPVFRLPSGIYVDRSLLIDAIHPGVFTLAFYGKEKAIGTIGYQTNTDYVSFVDAVQSHTPLDQTRAARMLQASPVLWWLAVFPALRDNLTAWHWLINQGRSRQRLDLARRIADLTTIEEKPQSEELVNEDGSELSFGELLLSQSNTYMQRLVLSLLVNKKVSLTHMNEELKSNSAEYIADALLVEWLKQTHGLQTEDANAFETVFQHYLAHVQEDPSLLLSTSIPRLAIVPQVLAWKMLPQLVLGTAQWTASSEFHLVWSLTDLLHFSVNGIRSVDFAHEKSVQKTLDVWNDMLQLQLSHTLAEYKPHVWIGWMAVVVRFAQRWHAWETSLQKDPKRQQQHQRQPLASVWPHLKKGLPFLWKSLDTLDVASTRWLFEPLAKLAPNIQSELFDTISAASVGVAACMLPTNRSFQPPVWSADLQLQQLQKQQHETILHHLYQPEQGAAPTVVVGDQETWLLKQLSRRNISVTQMRALINVVVKAFDGPQDVKDILRRMNLVLDQNAGFPAAVQTVFLADPYNAVYLLNTHDGSKRVTEWSGVAQIIREFSSKDYRIASPHDPTALSCEPFVYFKEINLFLDCNAIRTLNSPGMYELRPTTRSVHIFDVQQQQRLAPPAVLWTLVRKPSFLDESRHAHAVRVAPFAWWLELFPHMDRTWWHYLVETAPLQEQQAFAMYIARINKDEKEEKRQTSSAAVTAMWMEHLPPILARMVTIEKPTIRHLRPSVQQQWMHFATQQLLVMQAVYMLRQQTLSGNKDDKLYSKMWIDVMNQFAKDDVPLSVSLLNGYLQYNHFQPGTEFVLDAAARFTTTTDSHLMLSIDELQRMMATQLFPFDQMNNMEMAKNGFQQLRHKLEWHAKVSDKNRMPMLLIWIDLLFHVVKRWELKTKLKLLSSVDSDDLFWNECNQQLIHPLTEIVKQLDTAERMSLLHYIGMYSGVHSDLYDHIARIWQHLPPPRTRGGGCFAFRRARLGM